MSNWAGQAGNSWNPQATEFVPGLLNGSEAAAPAAPSSVAPANAGPGASGAGGGQAFRQPNPQRQAPGPGAAGGHLYGIPPPVANPNQAMQQGMPQGMPQGMHPPMMDGWAAGALPGWQQGKGSGTGNQAAWHAYQQDQQAQMDAVIASFKGKGGPPVAAWQQQQLAMGKGAEPAYLYPPGAKQQKGKTLQEESEEQSNWDAYGYAVVWNLSSTATEEEIKSDLEDIDFNCMFIGQFNMEGSFWIIFRQDYQAAALAMALDGTQEGHLKDNGQPLRLAQYKAKTAKTWARTWTCGDVPETVKRQFEWTMERLAQGGLGLGDLPALNQQGVAY